MARPSSVRALAEHVGRLCAPPGSGWGTSKSGLAPLAEDYHNRTFGSVDPRVIRARWLDGVRLAERPQVAILGVPYDGGTYGLGGAAAGPLGVRDAWRAPEGCVDLGDVPFFPGPPLDEMLAADVLREARAARYGDPTSTDPVCMLSVHLSVVRAAAAAGLRVLSIGGDHSTAATGMLGLAPPRMGLVHVDAHPDLSTGRDGLTLLHSSWIHYADRRLGLPVVVQVGASEGSPPEWVAGRWHSIVSLADPMAAAAEAAAVLAQAGAGAAYLSVDIDAVDGAEAPATGLPARSGLAVDALARFIQAIGARTELVGADLVEIAPPLSGRRRWSDEPTCVAGARLASRMVSALGGGGPGPGWTLPEVHPDEDGSPDD